MSGIDGKINEFIGNPGVGGGTGTRGDKITTPLGLAGYQWNLPPHKWSIPVEPADMVGDNVLVRSEKYMVGSSHKYRRGRIYWYARVGNEYVESSAYNDGAGKDPRYGFQFLWNPDTVTTSVSMNMEITPSFADKFVTVAGAFPSGEALALTLRLDRTNDFAAIKSIPKSPPKYSGSIANNNVETTYDKLAKNYANSNFYNPAHSFDGGAKQSVFVEKIQNLQKYGTIADIEYLYKAINGPGWVNQASGIKTSDIGFLSPTLLRIEIGPLSYLGYVSNLNVNHIGFSKGMIPIRTDVVIQFNLMATAGLAATKK